MITEIRTKVGLMAADVKTTYHVNWSTGYSGQKTGLLGLEGVLAKAYGKSLEIESSNGTTYCFNLKKEELDEYDRESLDEILDNDSFEDSYLPLILTDLCNKDIIPAGQYVITVSW
jgi:hypothetical protein